MADDIYGDWSSFGSDTDPFAGGSETGISPEGSAFGGLQWGDQFGITPTMIQNMTQPQGQLAPGQGQPGWGGNLGGIAQLGGVGLGLGGLLATLLGGGGQNRTRPGGVGGTGLTGLGLDALNALRGNIAQQAPLQQQMFQQGAGLLQGLQGGQIPAGLANTVNAAYQPYMQNLGQNAIEASQRAGFSLPQDAMQGGPGLRIMGQGLAQLPGQMAQTTLNTMFPLIDTLLGGGQQAIGNLQGAYNSVPGGGNVTQNQPGIGQRAQMAAPWLQGIGNVMNPPQLNMLMNPITGYGQQQQQKPYDFQSAYGQQ